jgi:lipoprotein NlpI
MASNLEVGLKLIQEGRFHEADLQLESEFTLSSRPNSEVFKYHGLLLMKIGDYKNAIIKFDSYLNNHPNDIVCLLGKQIALDLLKE